MLKRKILQSRSNECGVDLWAGESSVTAEGRPTRARFATREREKKSFRCEELLIEFRLNRSHPTHSTESWRMLEARKHSIVPHRC